MVASFVAVGPQFQSPRRSLSVPRVHSTGVTLQIQNSFRPAPMKVTGSACFSGGPWLVTHNAEVSDLGLIPQRLPLYTCSYAPGEVVGLCLFPQRSLTQVWSHSGLWLGFAPVIASLYLLLLRSRSWAYSYRGGLYALGQREVTGSDLLPQSSLTWTWSLKGP